MPALDDIQTHIYKMKNLTTKIFLASLISQISISKSFQLQINNHGIVSITATNTATTLSMASKGFGASSGGGFGSSSTKGSAKKNKVSKSDIKKTQKRVIKKYGKDVAQGTQKRVEDAMNNLPPHLYMATQLYQQLRKWDARLANMSVLQQAQISEPEMDGARRAQDELERLYRVHDFNEHDLHNIFQQITWDASADAKAARSITGDMPANIQARVDMACQVAADATGKTGKCLDVGCGYGVLVPHLLHCGMSESQIVGIDLSPEMIKNAREQHRGVQFEAVDFMNDFNSEVGFDAVLFCSALHDFSDMEAALKKAASLVRPRGKLIIAHPQGASHVERQSNANPVLVKRGLPTTDELQSLDLGDMTLTIEPAESNSEQEAKDGYFAVLTKKA